MAQEEACGIWDGVHGIFIKNIFLSRSLGKKYADWKKSEPNGKKSTPTGKKVRRLGKKYANWNKKYADWKKSTPTGKKVRLLGIKSTPAPLVMLATNSSYGGGTQARKS